jgi:flagellar motor component MotA
LLKEENDMVITGLALVVLILTGCILLLGGNPLIIWDSLSLILIIGIIISSLTAANLINDFFRGWKYLLLKKSVQDIKDLQLCILSFDLAYKSAIASGFIGTIMGLVLMLVNLMDSSYIWVYFAVCLLTTLYGVVLAFGLFLPCRSRLKKMIS